MFEQKYKSSKQQAYIYIDARHEFPYLFILRNSAYDSGKRTVSFEVSMSIYHPVRDLCRFQGQHYIREQSGLRVDTEQDITFPHHRQNHTTRKLLISMVDICGSILLLLLLLLLEEPKGVRCDKTDTITPLRTTAW